jgi:glycosyltransferase involved in cell wall biosynthesis
MTRLLIVNPGVQPELQKIVLDLDSNGFEIRYATASSFGYEFKTRFFSGNGKIANQFRGIYSRRILDFSDKFVIRFGFILELFSYFLFRCFGRNCRPIRNFYFYCRLLKFIAKWKPELVIFQDQIPLLYRLSKVLKFSTKVLVVSTASPMYFEKVFNYEKESNREWVRYFLSSGFSKFKQRAYLRDCKYSDRIVVPSKFVFDDLCDYVESSKIQVIRLGHDLKSIGVSDHATARPESLDSRGLNIIFVGQLSQRKGLSYLLDGFFSADIPKESVLTLVGTSVLGSAKRIREIYNSPQLRLMGHVSRSELGSLLAINDLFIMPSLIEGFCLSAIEALGTGIPVAVTDVVLDNLIVHDINGFLIEKHSSISISELFERLYSNKKIMPAIGEQGRRLALEFTWNTYRQEFTKFMLDVRNINSKAS